MATKRKDKLMSAKKQNLIWIDLEMTGLDTLNDEIIEIATVVTDKELNILAKGPIIAIHQNKALLDGMDAWNQKQHGGSGLIKRVQESSYSEAMAEKETLEFLREYVSRRASPMCGNSICQDRRFLARTMPELEAYFHYRNLDVSSFKEVVKRWKPKVLKGFTKKGSHLAMDDVLDSIEELKFYRENILSI